MDYKKHYDQLIASRQLLNRLKSKSGEYYEKHHIVPDFLFKDRLRNGPRGKILGDPNDASNLVLLTAREHIIAHFLLWKIYKGTHYEYPCVSSLLLMCGYNKSASMLALNRNSVMNKNWENQIICKYEDSRIKIGFSGANRHDCL